MKRIIRIISVIGLIVMNAQAMAEWRVDIESKQAGAGRQNITLEVTAYWDNPLACIAVPIVVREIDPGSFWTPGPKGLPYDTVAFLANPIRSSNRVIWSWSDPDWATIAEGLKSSAGCATPGNMYDGVSPDNFHFFGHGNDPGLAPEPNGTTILQIEFDVTGVPGQFEFDTACSIPTIPCLFMIEAGVPIIEHGPSGTNDAIFNKGIITIVPCSCGTWGDLSGDGQINPLDLPYIVNYTYKSVPFPIPLPTGCNAIQGDWNCDGAVTPLDVINLVNYVYRSHPCGPCDPCVE
jgi:hypothetical protein